MQLKVTETLYQLVERLCRGSLVLFIIANAIRVSCRVLLKWFGKVPIPLSTY